MNMIRKIDHVVITTQDMKSCLSFYETLGFSIVEKEQHYELHTPTFKINVHQKGKELLPHASHVTLGCHDFCFEVDDVEAYYDYLISKNIPICLGIVERVGVYGKMHSVYVRDYDGNLL